MDLLYSAAKIEAHNIEFSIFYEPDIGNTPTAIATRPVYGQERKVFQKFQLMQGESQ